MSRRSKILIVALLSSGSVAALLGGLLLSAKPLVMVCDNRPPVLLHGEWWPGSCAYTSVPGSDSEGDQIAACYCSWWLARHPDATIEQCTYPQPSPRWLNGPEWLCSSSRFNTEPQAGL